MRSGETQAKRLVEIVISILSKLLFICNAQQLTFCNTQMVFTWEQNQRQYHYCPQNLSNGYIQAAVRTLIISGITVPVHGVSDFLFCQSVDNESAVTI